MEQQKSVYIKILVKVILQLEVTHLLQTMQEKNVLARKRLKLTKQMAKYIEGSHK